MALYISVANDFSRYPGGRFEKNGKWSGEEFRKKFLKPAMEKNEPFIVDLNGVRGYPPSFLEEAFGGLIRDGFSLDEIKSRMKIICSKASRIEEIEMYIQNEAERLSSAL